MNCPNGCGSLVQTTDNKQECPKCGYSFVAPAKKGNKYTEEVNREIKNLLVAARLGDEQVPWKREWVVIPKRNYDSNRIYSGINRWLLSFDGSVCYLTRDSVEKHGLTIPDDVHPRLVVAWVPPKLTKEEKMKMSEEEQRQTLAKRRPFMVTSFVYRANDIPGLKEKTFASDKDNKRYASIDEFIQSIKGLKLEEGGNSAVYLPGYDTIRIPRIQQFDDSDEYYRTLFHELVHWTGHESRLARDEKKYQAKEAYGREELIAEMGASYLCHYFGIKVTENSVAYIDGWLKKIDADPNLLVSAGQQAEKVLRYFGLAE